jgi:hypothetical protein
VRADDGDGIALMSESPPAGGEVSRRLRVSRRPMFDFWLDTVMLIAFTLDFSFRFTGLAIHEWIGVVFVVTVPVHLTQHWDGWCSAQ